MFCTSQAIVGNYQARVSHRMPLGDCLRLVKSIIRQPVSHETVSPWAFAVQHECQLVGTCHNTAKLLSMPSPYVRKSHTRSNFHALTFSLKSFLWQEVYDWLQVCTCHPGPVYTGSKIKIVFTRTGPLQELECIAVHALLEFRSDLRHWNSKTVRVCRKTFKTRYGCLCTKFDTFNTAWLQGWCPGREFLCFLWRKHQENFQHSNQRRCFGYDCDCFNCEPPLKRVSPLAFLYFTTISLGSNCFSMACSLNASISSWPRVRLNFSGELLFFGVHNIHPYPLFGWNILKPAPKQTWKLPK